MTIAHPPTAGKEQPDSTPSFSGARSHQESVRSKIVLSLAGIFLLFLAIDEMVRQQLIQPGFNQLVEFNTTQDGNRVQAALNAEVEHLNVLTTFWANHSQPDESASAWDSEFKTNRLPKCIDWAATVSPTGHWRWLAQRRKGRTQPSDESAGQAFQSLLRNRQHAPQGGIQGITRLGRNSLALFSLITLQQEDSKHAGLLLVARELDNDLLDSVRRQTQIAFTLPSSASDDRELTEKQAEKSKWDDESKRAVEIPIVDLDGKRLAPLAIELPRRLTANSHLATRLARNAFILSCITALLILLHLLHKIVIRPLTTIGTHSDRLFKAESHHQPQIRKGHDEMHELAAAFDEMAHRLSETERKLNEVPEEGSGIQVASSVIHNVGNVQTNVNSLIEAACDRTRRLRISPLNKLAERLRSGEPNAAMLEATPDYLEHLAGSLQSDQQSINELLCTLNDNVRHIRDIIHAQQQHTEPSLKICPLQIQDLIEEAVSCCRARLEADAVKISVSGQVQVEIHCDRSLMLQTMINLIGNARNALRSIDSSTRHLLIDVRSGPERIEIDFQDNGCGISPEILDHIFDSRFTTRESGTGLGLHFCAVTLKRLGGSIRAASKGLNQGSVFTIEVPRSIDLLVHSTQIAASGKTS